MHDAKPTLRFATMDDRTHPRYMRLVANENKTTVEGGPSSSDMYSRVSTENGMSCDGVYVTQPSPAGLVTGIVWRTSQHAQRRYKSTLVTCCLRISDRSSSSALDRKVADGARRLCSL